MITPPTCEEIYNEELELVHTEADPSWRHGCYIYEVYNRESDNTFWAVNYRRSTDGETNALREGLADVKEVEPYEVTRTEYRKKI